MVCLLLWFDILFAQKDYVIEGKVSGVADGAMVVLQKQKHAGGFYSIDTAQTLDRRFRFAIRTNEPDLYRIQADNRARDFIWDGNLTLTGANLASAQLAGSKLTEEWERYKEQYTTPLVMRLVLITSQLDAARAAGDTALHKSLADSMDVVSKQTNAQAVTHAKDYIFKNPSSFLSLWLLSGIWSRIGEDERKACKKAIAQDPLLRKHSLYDKLGLPEKEKTDNDKNWINKPSPRITGTDMNGNPFDSESIQGNLYVVLDFWGTWCGPCIKSIPQLQALHKQYQAKNVQFVSIAYEKKGSEDKWREAVEKHGMDWTQLYQEQEDKSPASPVSSYSVRLFPTFVVINPKGRIVYRATDISQLTTFLAKEVK